MTLAQLQSFVLVARLGSVKAAAAQLQLRPGAPVWAAVKATEIDVYPSGPVGDERGDSARAMS